MPGKASKRISGRASSERHFLVVFSLVALRPYRPSPGAFLMCSKSVRNKPSGTHSRLPGDPIDLKWTALSGSGAPRHSNWVRNAAPQVEVWLSRRLRRRRLCRAWTLPPGEPATGAQSLFLSQTAYASGYSASSRNPEGIPVEAIHDLAPRVIPVSSSNPRDETISRPLGRLGDEHRRRGDLCAVKPRILVNVHPRAVEEIGPRSSARG